MRFIITYTDYKYQRIYNLNVNHIFNQKSTDASNAKPLLCNYTPFAEIQSKITKTYDVGKEIQKYTDENGNNNLGILQCTAKYPAPIETLNLSTIPELNSRYDLPIGLSDHSLDPIIGPLMSIGIGGKFIEKHFTIDKKLPGPDHRFALDPQELKLMIKTIRDGEKSKGDKIKKIINEEKELKEFATRSIQAIKNIVKGDILQERINFEILRPGKRIRGLDARFLNDVNGKKATKDISIGDGIKDFE